MPSHDLHETPEHAREPDESPLSDSHVGLLPAHLAERAHALNPRGLDPSGEFVLCWLHHAIRDHENPALDAAIEIANLAHKPVLVYQGLGGHHRYNSDRHHAFILQGARDLARGLAGRGIPYAFHLPADPADPAGNTNARATPIRELIDRAALVVTEDFPAPPFPAWSAAHARRARCGFLAIDSACVMPIRLLGTRHDRAFAFRDKAKHEWQTRISKEWHEAEYEGPGSIGARGVPDGLDPESFIEPGELTDRGIAELCARCRIDHAVPSVARSGGSVAGYARWDAFVREQLGRYDKRRNDAADMNAVSCLSPYLHHGHVSPFRIAREAHEFGGPGAEKFLDELLVWRELACNFCTHTTPDTLETLGALPEWARSTLADHAGDPREGFHSWEMLARAQSGDELWDWAQRSLLWNGELHNNIRMTWGKMIPRWTCSPERALVKLIDLNHRFALDGSNPNSYGGLLWCLGQFDRPSDQDNPITGTVRERTTAVHASRLSTERYAGSVRSRSGHGPMRVAVVGGGVAGLACARTLKDHGCLVTVFDKGREVGGRLSVRDSEAGAFDHGGPAFGVTDERFARCVRSWIDEGACGVWRPSVGVIGHGRLHPIDEPRPLAVGAPGMSAVCAHLASDVDVERSTTVTSIERTDGAWSITVQPYKEDMRTIAGFDAVVLAGASPQSARLVATLDTPVRDALAEAAYQPQWVLMGTLEGGGSLCDVIRCADHEAIDKIVREGSKPGRDGGTRVVVHAMADWSRARYEADRDEIARELTGELERVLGSAGIKCTFVADRAHRWGFARPTAICDQQCAWDGTINLAACGDGFAAAVGDNASRIEDGVQNAYLSGVAAAGRVLSARPVRTVSALADDQDAPSLFASND